MMKKLWSYLDGILLVEVLVWVGIVSMVVCLVAGGYVQYKHQNPDFTVPKPAVGFTIITIDGCQYIMNPSGSMFAHKANCTNHAGIKVEQ